MSDSTQFSDYQRMLDNLFQAFDTIASEKLNHLEFDKTIICKISDITNRDRGEYVVTDGSSSFNAYSENTTYNVGASVYVTIPNGDFNKQKTITGKYISQDSMEYYTYRPAMDSYVDITTNLISSTEDNPLLSSEVGLTANNINKKEIVIWKWAATEESGPLKEYDRLGLKADFKSLLSEYNLYKGSYGLRVDIIAEDDTTTENKTVDSKKYYSYKLDSSNMYGNVYDFSVFYKQEAVFDISSISKIIGIQISFYQDNNFEDNNETRIPSTYSLGENSYTLPANLFVKNIYISAGYDLTNFTEDRILLYTLDSATYASKLKEDVTYSETTSMQTVLNQKNLKHLKMRWIHVDPETGDISSYDSLTDRLPESYAIHWFRYKLEDNIDDPLGGAFWEDITDQLKDPFNIEIIPNTNDAFERFKVMVISPTVEDNESKRLEDIKAELYSYLLKEKEIDTPRLEFDLATELAEIISIKSTTNKQQEGETKLDWVKRLIDDNQELISAAFDKYMAQWSANVKIYSSEVLELLNENPPPNAQTLALIRGANILCDTNGLNGDYKIYGNDGYILNPSEASRQRLFTLTYDTLITGVESLDSVETIIWKIPVTNTMIETPTLGIEYSEEDKWEIKDGYMFITRYNASPEGYQPGDEVANQLQQRFRIKDYFNSSAINNTVYCEIIKNTYPIDAEYDLIFGARGTNGTDYTFILKESSSKNCLLYNDEKSDRLFLVPTILDYEDNDITDTLQTANINYDWYSAPMSKTVNEVLEHALKLEKQGKNCSISFNPNFPNLAISDCYYGIVRAKWQKAVTLPGKMINDVTDTVEEDSENSTKLVTLVAYYPVVISTSNKYVSYEGVTNIAYNSSGINPQYYKSNHNLYYYDTIDNKKQLVAEPNVTWEIMIYNLKDDEAKFYPTFNNEAGDKSYKITAPSMYMQDTNKRIAIAAKKEGKYIWVQPVRIYQEVYSSAMLNSWDGSLTIDEKNGTILSAMIGAGKKNDDNSFSGVLMGDVSIATNETTASSTNIKLNQYYKGIGLYGYDSGVKSFGLNINGKAFFGAAGRGQILIDGTSGIIQSANYITNDQGMKIDLDTGKLDAKNTGGSIHINPTDSDALFVIKAPNTDGDFEKIMNVGAGNNNYYLKTVGFSSETDKEQGVKIDLGHGKIEAYNNFTIYAKNSSGNYAGSYIKISNTGDPFLRVHNKCNEPVYRYISLDLDENAKVPSGSYKKIEIESDPGRYEYQLVTNDTQESGVEYFSRKTIKTEQDLDILNITKNDYVLRSHNWVNGETGTQFDLKQGEIKSYNFTIEAYGKDTNHKIKIDSGALRYPLEIGPNFKVRWDGSIKAYAGEIGGWTISSEGLYSTGVGLFPGGTNQDSTLRIHVGNITYRTAYFNSNGTEISKSSYDALANDSGKFSKKVPDANSGGNKAGFNVSYNSDGGVMEVNKGVLSNCDIDNATITRGTISSANIYYGWISSATITNATITGSLTFGGKPYSFTTAKIQNSYYSPYGTGGWSYVHTMGKTHSGTLTGTTTAQQISVSLSDVVAGKIQIPSLSVSVDASGINDHSQSLWYFKWMNTQSQELNFLGTSTGSAAEETVPGS